MAAIEKRTASDGTTSYRVKVRLRGHPVQGATFASLTKAKQWGAQTEAAIREGRYFQTVEAKRHTLAETIKRYERENLPGMKSAQHRRGYNAFWIERLGAFTLADLTPAAINDALRDLATERNLGPQSVTHYRQALASVLTEAVKTWQWMEQSPMHRVPKPALPRGRTRYLSDDERARLLEACKASTNADLYTAVLLALTTGGRQAETMGATWRQVDLNRATLTLEETKNGSRRSLHLVEPVLALLRERSKLRRIDSDLLFPSRVNPRQPVDLRQPWERALRDANIENFHWHDLRHTFASMAAMNGASLPELAALLGHRTLQMVQRYAHLSPQHTANLAERVASKMLGGAV
ncbi:site-specific integrase [Acidithiobacillus sp. CV18-2]|nr:site-specific integrase [Acidithiobacillus sp. CV18-3]MBU2757524.1 site-specific integrase [Acidithiobacillus sp. BN09-2]MBU2778252.1 site-specific integrase [Acidithiobacillus sp. CV18-2]MBU2799688.1 site-specific integrase [Acidithiobacillus sp. VAN18-4]